MRGKVAPVTRSLKSPKDHPRVCGGKESAGLSRRKMRGITPACAGKRSTRWKGLIRWQDHPRVCGEKVLLGSYNRSPQGSPPRARGKALPDRGHPLSRGITPAYAGKSLQHLNIVVRLRDHPRVRGEKTVHLKTCLKQTGSPPRTRGKVIISRSFRVSCRITPAYAGKRTAS